MDPIFATGVLGGLVTVFGAAWPEGRSKKPIHSIKNWLLAIGALILLAYAALDYYAGGAFFFVLLELLVIVASVMMMLDVRDEIDVLVIGGAGVGFVIWSLMLYEDFNTIFFIMGLTGASLGYALQMGTKKRFLAFVLGSLLLTYFSYAVGNMVFFWLNLFFTIFSAYYLVRMLKN